MKAIVKDGNGKIVGTEDVFINPDAITSVSKYMNTFVVRISDSEIYVISQQEFARILPETNLV